MRCMGRAVSAVILGAVLAVVFPLAAGAAESGAPPTEEAKPAGGTAGTIPPVVNPANLYSETAAGKLSPAVAGALSRVYVPHIQSNDVYVIDPATFQVVDRFRVRPNPQHIIPSWDLKTLWVASSVFFFKQKTAYELPK